jgi:hypothetical protein
MAQANALTDPDAAAGRININCQRANVIFLWGQSDPGFSRTAVEHGRARVESLGRLRVALASRIDVSFPTT